MKKRPNQFRKLIADVYLILTLDCEASARLTSDSFDRQLDWAERTAGFLHRMICAKSRRLDRQLKQLHATVVTTQQVGLSDTAKSRIGKLLHDHTSRLSDDDYRHDADN